MRVLLHDSHSIYDPGLGRLRAYGGAPGESDYIRALNDRIVALAPGDMSITRIAGDMKAHPEFAQDWDAFLAPHYESDTHGHEGGWFWGRAAQSLTGPEDDRLGRIFERRFNALTSVPAQRQGWMTVNVTDYYAFRQTTSNTPGVLVELGVGAPVCNGHGFPSAPDHAWLRGNLDAIARTVIDTMAEFGGLVTNTRYAVLGTSSVIASQLARSLNNPTVPEIPLLYADLCRRAGIRAEIAFAQALKETNHFRFTGTAKPEWHNPAGLGVTGAQDAGNRFPDWESGVRAHLGHLLWYVGQHVSEFCDKDQRHFGGHKNLPNDVRSLNGKWAVPGIGYGESIANIADAILATPEPTLWDERPDETPATLGDLRRYARALAKQLA